MKGVRNFLRHAGFYRRFIKDFSKTAKPLTLLLTKDNPCIFSNGCLKAFYKIKEALVTALVIQPPDWSLPFEIICDVSDYAIGEVLGQRRDKNPYVIYYASKTFDKA